MRRHSVKAGMWPQAIVEIQIAADGSSRDAYAVVGVKVDLLVFDRFPDALDEDIVAPSALAIHADGDIAGRQSAREGLTRELAALVGVENLRRPVFRQASSSASTQKAASIVMDTRWPRTRRLNQSTTAVR